MQRTTLHRTGLRQRGSWRDCGRASTVAGENVNLFTYINLTLDLLAFVAKSFFFGLQFSPFFGQI